MIDFGARTIKPSEFITATRSIPPHRVRALLAVYLPGVAFSGGKREMVQTLISQGPIDAGHLMTIIKALYWLRRTPEVPVHDGVIYPPAHLLPKV